MHSSIHNCTQVTQIQMQRKVRTFHGPQQEKTNVFKVICKFYFQRPHFIAAAPQLEDSPVGFYTLETKKCVCE